MISPTDKNAHYIYGWSETVLHYIAMSIKGYDNMIEDIDKIEIGQA